MPRSSALTPRFTTPKPTDATNPSGHRRPRHHTTERSQSPLLSVRGNVAKAATAYADLSAGRPVRRQRGSLGIV